VIRWSWLLCVGCATPASHEAKPVPITTPNVAESTTPAPVEPASVGDPRWAEQVREERVLSFRGLACGDTEHGVRFTESKNANDPQGQLALELGCRSMNALLGLFCCPSQLSPVAPSAHSAGGKSCEEAIHAYVATLEPRAPDAGPPQQTGGQYGAVLNRGAYFAHCAIPNDVEIRICAAVREGRVEGVTVTTKPHDSKQSECVADAVRSLTFPAHPKLDVTRTTFQ
jgi:hypothetical protein